MSPSSSMSRHPPFLPSPKAAALQASSPLREAMGSRGQQSLLECRVIWKWWVCATAFKAGLRSP
eukprot:457421-Alexandrium_andersonii.AAC.1